MKLLFLLILLLIKVSIITMIKRACLYYNQHQKYFYQITLYLVLYANIKDNFMHFVLHNSPVTTKLLTAKVVASHPLPTSTSERVQISVCHSSPPDTFNSHAVVHLKDINQITFGIN